jgi:hypothetical protein
MGIRVPEANGEIMAAGGKQLAFRAVGWPEPRWEKMRLTLRTILQRSFSLTIADHNGDSFALAARATDSIVIAHRAAP